MSAENFIFIDSFAVRVDGSDVNPGIRLYENSLQIPGSLTSLPSTLTAKKVYEDGIFGRQDILHFCSGESKDYKYVKFPQTSEAL